MNRGDISRIELLKSQEQTADPIQTLGSLRRPLPPLDQNGIGLWQTMAPLQSLQTLEGILQTLTDPRAQF